MNTLRAQEERAAEAVAEMEATAVRWKRGKRTDKKDIGLTLSTSPLSPPSPPPPQQLAPLGL